MKVIESCQTVVNKINEIENFNTPDQICHQQKNEKELSKLSGYSIEMDDCGEIDINVNGTNGETTNIQTSELTSDNLTNKCKVNETKTIENSDKQFQIKKDNCLEKESLICKITRTPSVDNLFQNINKNKKDNDNAQAELSSSENKFLEHSKQLLVQEKVEEKNNDDDDQLETEIKSKRLKLDQDNEKPKIVLPIEKETKLNYEPTEEPTIRDNELLNKDLSNGSPIIESLSPDDLPEESQTEPEEKEKSKLKRTRNSLENSDDEPSPKKINILEDETIDQQSFQNSDSEEKIDDKIIDTNIEIPESLPCGEELSINSKKETQIDKELNKTILGIPENENDNEETNNINEDNKKLNKETEDDKEIKDEDSEIINNINETNKDKIVLEKPKNVEIKEDNDIILIEDKVKNEEEKKDFLKDSKERQPLPGVFKFITEEKPILTKKDLSDILIQQFCNIIHSKSELGQTRAKCHFLEQSNKKLKTQLESINKQVVHLTKALHKLTAQTEGKDKPPLPLKLVRSVAIQVGRSRFAFNQQAQQNNSSSGSQLNKSKPNVNTNVKNNIPVNNSPNTTRSTEVSISRSTISSQQDNTKVNSPLKGIKTILPRSNKTPTQEERSQPPKAPPILTPSPNNVPPTLKPKTPPVLTPNPPSNTNHLNKSKSNSLKNLPDPPKLTPKNNNTVIDIDLTEEDEIPQTNNSSVKTNKPTNKIIPARQIKPLTNRKQPTTVALVSPVNTLQTINSKPQQVWNNIIPKKGEIRLIPNGGLRCIPPTSVSQNQAVSAFLLTSSPSLPSNVIMTSPNTSNDISNQGTYILKNGKLINAQLAVVHPAPLPPQPTVQINPTWLSPPPRPDLQISRVNAKAQNGIVLSWMMHLTREFAEIVSYQLYAYEETQGAKPSTSLWKKVGDVKALPLPMACTLTQFVVGHKYHFAVRAVDVHARIGPFSQPESIVLNIVGK